MLAEFERKVVYLSDNATQTETTITKNTVEIKKIQKLGYINFDLCVVTYVTIVSLLLQRQVHNTAACFPLAFVEKSLQGHWWGFLAATSKYGPSAFLRMCSLLLKDLTFVFLFAFIVVGVVQCGGHKTSPRTSTIVQFIFHFWSFEINKHILRNQNLIIDLDSHSRQHLIYLDPILIYISHRIDCLFEIHNTAACFPLTFVAKSLQGHWCGFFSRNLEVWPIYFPTNVFTAIKGTHFCIFIPPCCSWWCAVWRP